ncbi:primosomal protein N' [Pediococcus claussenii]|uniref:primosomal protein N' n=1 Tax=Pediococcus claussenii TaxID=187452 RepID=UPI00081AA85A|nr:primosomal protein N' [Pediococcus claussenii]ANZ70669.1 primosomal protein N' [Pediococcus claussenii]
MSKKIDVIVDIPALQTNQNFTYLVDDSLENLVKVGSRVLVPFGQAGRPVQAYVISIESQANLDDLKNINALLDPEPMLNSELISLSNWLADQTYSFRANVLRAMLPNLLKLNTRRYVLVNEEKISKNEVLDLLGVEQANDLRIAELTHMQQAKLNEWVNQGVVELKYAIADTAKIKTEMQVYPNLSESDLKIEVSQLASNATGQIKLLKLLGTLDEDGIAQKKLINEEKIGRSTIESAEKKHWIIRKAIEKYRNPFQSKTVQSDSALILNSEQKIAKNMIDRQIKSKDSTPILLEGVTGSGKTEVYLQSIAEVVKQGKTAIMLVPEISLTPLMVNRVRARFGNQVAVLHSALSDGEKFDEWRRIVRQEVSVVVGARSAVFAPLQNLGIVIVDEEHSSTYKQEDTPRYSARDVAVYRARTNKCPVVLGSATPSLESRARAEKKVYNLVQMKERANKHDLPTIKIIDMRKELNSRADETFSKGMLTAINDRIAKKEQIVLLLNRRGFSSFVMCRSCGFVLKCPNCDVSLTMHVDTHSMRCHYCGHEEVIPKACKNCGSEKIRFYGTGTEKVEKQLAKLVPDAKVIRMDVDTTRRKGAHERLLDRFGNHEADILLGTQMIAKGLDFPDVTLVGVLNADTSLELPDFRSAERTFQLLTQVAGRAGRADKEGEVLIQSFNPDHYAIKLAQKQDYEDFFIKEMYLRKLGKYPPYFFTVQVAVSSGEEKTAAKVAFDIVNKIKKVVSDRSVILGPSPRSIAKIKQKYFYQLVIKFQKEPGLDQVLRSIRDEAQKQYRQGISISIDPEPQVFI